MKILTKLLFSVFSYLYFVTTCIAMDTISDPNSIIQKYNLQEFEDVLNLPVVHATHVFPIDGRMIPGKTAKEDYNINGLNIRKGEVLSGPMGWRPTLHWAIGKLADDIDENTLSDRPYAIITTLKQLLPQLIGINLEDTFILGEFKIPEGSCVIIREDLQGAHSEEAWLARVRCCPTASGNPYQRWALGRYTEAFCNRPCKSQG